MIAVLLAALAACSTQEADTLQPGLSVRVYFIGRPMESLVELAPGQTPNVSFIVPELDLDSRRMEAPGGLDEMTLTEVDGWLRIPESGAYELRLDSDDGSALWVDGKEMIGLTGLRSLGDPRVLGLEFAEGDHPILVRWFNNLGGWGLRLEWRRMGEEDFQVVPSEFLRCRAGEVRVTSPGRKLLVDEDSRMSPGDGMPLEDVHPSFDRADVRPEGFEPRVGGLDWLPDGRLAVATWDDVGSVWILDGVTQDDPALRTATRFAAGLAEPLGLATVGERIFVLQKQELTELVDTDGDGVADEYLAVCSGWPVSANFHEFAFGLVHRDGSFYANLAIAIDPGGKSTKPQVEERGTVLEISLAEGTWRTAATGLRTPNGIGFGAGGDIWLTDNQGDWVPVSKLLHFADGAFYGSRAALSDDAPARIPITKPAVWLPQNEIGNSPSQPSLFPDSCGPYAGQMLHGEVTHGGVKRDFVEQIDGAWQGCVFRFTQGLDAGINRIAWGPDGALYVGGIGSTGNWGQTGKKRFGLERLRYNGKPTFEMLAVRARSDGFEVELTEPLREGLGWDPESWRVTQWRYEPTEDYGGPKLDEQELAVLSAHVSPDRRRVFLEIAGLLPEHVVHLRLVDAWRSEAGRTPWSTETWYTLNAIPADRPGFHAERPAERPRNVLSEAERADGWRLLFDGATLAGWHRYGAPEIPPAELEGWNVRDGAIERGGTGETAIGDLVTDEVFEDFELALEWKVSPGGNSGVFFHVADGLDATWLSGPEVQVLDNSEHADGRNPFTSAGSAYGLYAPVRDATRPAGLWNEARLRVQDGRVTHWLNGVELLSYRLGDADWLERVEASKFAAFPGYGRAGRGRIALQDHGDAVWFRDVKLRALD